MKFAFQNFFRPYWFCRFLGKSNGQTLMLKIEPKWNMYCFLETWEHTLKWLDKRMIHMPQQTIIIWPISILHCIQRLYTGNGLTDFIHLRPWKFLVVIRHCVRLPLLILLVSSAYTGQQSRRGQTKTPLPSSGDSTSILLCRRLQNYSRKKERKKYKPKRRTMQPRSFEKAK